MSRQSTFNLPAGKVLTVSADAFTAGSARRLASSGDTTTNYPVQAVAASTSLVLGPFTNDRSYAVVSDSGNTLTAVITQPDQNTAQLIVTNMTADGAVTIAPGIVTLNKSGVIAATLAAPTAEQEGMLMRFTSKSANAHTITATGLLHDGVTGGAKDVATFAAFLGASITIIAINLKWHVLALNAVTVAAA